MTKRNIFAILCCGIWTTNISNASQRHRLKPPHSSYFSKPLTSSYTAIEYADAEFIIGETERQDDIFEDPMPDQITAICKLNVRSEFPDVLITAGYKATPGGPILQMAKKIYDGSELNNGNLISEISIEFLNSQSDIILHKSPSKNSLIYTKKFPIQAISKRIPNYPDTTNSSSGILMTKTEAYPFAGLYFPGIALSEIQPQLFYLGTGLESKPYIKSISAREAFRNPGVKICKEVSQESISSLEDDITEKKVKIILNDVEYSSLSAKKTTLNSDVFTILFEKDKS